MKRYSSMKHKYHRTEAEDQADLMKALKELGLHIGLEQKIVLGSKTRTGRNECIRVDVGIFQNEELVACIEVKRGGKTFKKGTRQHRKYEELGLPYRYCFGENEIEDCVEWAKQFN